MIDGIRKRVKEAGAPTEDSTERNGFLSYKSETHATAVGISSGVAITATGNVQLAGMLLTLASAGIRGTKVEQKSRVARDIYREPHYAIAGLAAGWLVGKFTGQF